MQRRLPTIPGNANSAAHQQARAKGGADAERFVDSLNDLCARAGVAYVHRVASQHKILRPLGRGVFAVAITGRSVVDLMGVMADGRAVAADVKHVATAHLKDGSEAAWRLELHRVEEHQRTMLAQTDAVGGVAFVLVVHNGRVFAVPWSVVSEAIGRGAASLSRDEITPHLCDHREPYLAHYLTGRVA